MHRLSTPTAQPTAQARRKSFHLRAWSCRASADRRSVQTTSKYNGRDDKYRPTPEEVRRHLSTYPGSVVIRYSSERVLPDPQEHVSLDCRGQHRALAKNKAIRPATSTRVEPTSTSSVSPDLAVSSLSETTWVRRICPWPVRPCGRRGKRCPGARPGRWVRPEPGQ